MSFALQAAKRIRAEAKKSGAEKLRPGKKGLPLSSKSEFMVLITTVFFLCKAFSACSVKDYWLIFGKNEKRSCRRHRTGRERFSFDY